MDQDTKQALDNLRDFLSEHMVTKQEIEERFETLPTKNDFHQLQNGVDAIAKGYLTYEQELRITSARTLEMEDWIRKAADKIGIRYNP